ncbi:unnamed protein product [Onchocerca ochengi]|uniref:Uncharacterized protein n=1 Tax=Onchocerca ochengi TaxID=42157 RepID=A0A182EKF4_ONCOC|nr:unnamed protein product [Onchocerca ochengi]
MAQMLAELRATRLEDARLRAHQSFQQPQLLQMTSFGEKTVTTQCMLTFKVKGQIHYKAGSLLPPPHSQHKFLQIYFIGDGNDELNACCGFRPT